MPTQGKRVLRITAVLIGLVGLPMIWYGIELTLVGGTPYYAITGTLISLSAVELWRVSRRGWYLFASALLLTLAWAVYEAGTEFWLVGSRIWIIGLLSLWLCTPMIRRPLWDGDAPRLLRMRTAQVCAAATVLVLGAMTVNLLNTPVLPSRIQNTALPGTRRIGKPMAGVRRVPVMHPMPRSPQKMLVN
jgi:quinoprotein glucose dehydrogenase